MTNSRTASARACDYAYIKTCIKRTLKRALRRALPCFNFALRRAFTVL